jgi:hypothetical protein
MQSVISGMKIKRSFIIAAIPLWLVLVCSALGVVIAFVSDLLVQSVL